MAGNLRILGLLLIIISILAACGGQNAGPTATLEPTATLFPTFAFVAPTNPPVFDSSVGGEVTATPDTVIIERGRGRYEALDCGTCHGDSGEGTDEGSRLIGFDMTETDFISFMRSGGELGTKHQYSTDRLSERGGQSLYQYLLSLDEG